MLLYIKKNISILNYDLIFFSFFEEISFVFANLKGNIVLMNHSNVSGLKSYIKRFFLKKCNLNAKFLVFHNSIKARFAEFGINNVIVEPLGLSQPYFKIIDEQTLGQINKVYSRTFSENFKFRILIPSDSKYGSRLIANHILNEKFLNFLEKENILIIIKSNSINILNKNILQINPFLPDHIYKLFFNISDTIILDYPETFEYKVSAALFECFSNNKPVLLSSIKSFKIYNEYFNYNPYYLNTEQLINLIYELRLYLIDNNKKCYKNIENLNPNLNSIFNGI